MMTLKDRAGLYDFWAAATPETMDVIIDRVLRLVKTGRKMTLVRRYMDSPATPEVKTSLAVDTDTFTGGIEVRESYGVKSLSVLLAPGVERFGVFAYPQHSFRPRSEADLVGEIRGVNLRKDPKATPREILFVEVSGFGDGKQDRIVLTNWNDNGVGIETVIAFEYTERQERAETDARLLDLLAQNLRDRTAAGEQAPAWDIESLTSLAKGLRDNWEDLPEHLAYLAKEQATPART